MDNPIDGGQANPEQTRMLYGILAYLGPLVVLSYVLGAKDPFVKFHIKQGLVLFCIEVIVYLLASVLWQFWMFVSLINLCTLVLSILGIVNVAQHKQQSLPLVGQWAHYFNI